MSLTLQPFSWEIADESGENITTCIRCWALDRNNEAHLIRIEDFPNTCHVELPLVLDGVACYWSYTDAQNFAKFLNTKMEADGPIDFGFQYRKRLYFADERTYPTVYLAFRTAKALKSCSRILSRPVFIKGKGRVKVEVWENRVPFLRKFWTRVNIEPAQWFNAPAHKVDGIAKISRLEHEYLVSWEEIKAVEDPASKGWISHPKILCFDIEAYSKNKKAFPDKWSASDVCYMISVITQRTGMPETRKRQVVIFGDCHDIEGVEVIRTNSELECIDTFSALVNENDPDIIMGYNHHGFDNDYMDCRLRAKMKKWQEMGRLIGEIPKLRSWSWSSAAYGHNEVHLLEMSGRISIDIYTVIKRDHKLPQYDLGTVGMKFVGRSKHPVKPEHIFIAYENYWSRLSPHKKSPSDETKNSLDEAIDEMTRITRYCVEDAELTLDVAEKVHIWIASVELSNIVGVSIMDLYTRGQQIRCLSKIYDTCHRDGVVIDFHEALNVVFNGGLVQKPIQGVEDEVPCYDFCSLYPSIIDELNIDYSTYIRPEDLDKYKPEDYHTVSFEQMERPKRSKDKLSKDDFEVDAELGNAAKEVHRDISFLNKSVREGYVPRIVRYLVDERRKVKDQMEELVERKKRGENVDEVQIIVLNQRQLGLKVTANSFFGFFGAHIGKLPLIEAAMAITAKGREMIHQVQNHLETKYKAKIVYGDTDSVMPKFPGLEGKTWQEKFAFWKVVEKELSDMFPGRVKMELEKIMRIICFAPKMYAYLKYDFETGILAQLEKDIEAKGIVLARRDGTPWVRKHYRKIICNILIKYSADLSKLAESIESSFSMVVDAALEIIEGKVNWQDLAKINEMGASYKNPNYPMAVLGERLRRIGRPAQPGDRLRYVICAISGETKVGPKMRTDDEFMESQETENPLKLDVNYYLENALKKKLDPLFEVGYNKLLPLMADVGYKPMSLKHFVPIDEPVRLLVRAYEDKQDLSKVKGWFKGHIDEVLSNYYKPKRTMIVRCNIPVKI